MKFPLYALSLVVSLVVSLIYTVLETLLGRDWQRVHNKISFNFNFVSLE